MKKNILIFSLIILILVFIIIGNPYLIDQFPWDPSIKFERNIEPYLIILLTSFACYTTINTLYSALGIQDTKKHKSKVIGNIINIEYSSIRVNNSPRFKVTVEYSGITKSFDALDEAVQFHLVISDEAIIYHEENNPRNSHINLEETIKRKRLSNTNKLEANSKFKLKEINLINGTSNYSLIGEIINKDKTTTRASFNQTITDDNLQKFIPGMIIPCRVEGTGRELTISMVVI